MKGFLIQVIQLDVLHKLSYMDLAEAIASKSQFVGLYSRSILSGLVLNQVSKLLTVEPAPEYRDVKNKVSQEHRYI